MVTYFDWSISIDIDQSVLFDLTSIVSKQTTKQFHHFLSQLCIAYDGIRLPLLSLLTFHCLSLCFTCYFLFILFHYRRRRPAIIRDAGPLQPSSIGLCWLQPLSTGHDEGAHGPPSLWQFGTSEQTGCSFYPFTMIVGTIFRTEDACCCILFERASTGRGTMLAAASYYERTIGRTNDRTRARLAAASFFELVVRERRQISLF